MLLPSVGSAARGRTRRTHNGGWNVVDTRDAIAAIWTPLRTKRRYTLNVLPAVWGELSLSHTDRRGVQVYWFEAGQADQCHCDRYVRLADVTAID